MLNIVIPVYNESSTVIRAINSVLQPQFDFVNNVIVVDDYSTDNGLELIKQYINNIHNTIYKNKIVVLKHDSNAGVAAARNSGIRYSILNNKNIQFIAFLDADDYFASKGLDDAFYIINNNNYSHLSCIKFQLNLVDFPNKYVSHHLFKHLVRQFQLLTMMGIFRKDVLSCAAADSDLNPVPVGDVFRKRGEDFCFMNAIRKTTHVGMIFSNKNNYGLCHCYHENMFAERFFDSRLFGVNKYPLTNEENEIIKNQELLIKNNLINNLLKNNSNSELINFDNDFVPFIV